MTSVQSQTAMKTPTETRHILDKLEAQHPDADTELHYTKRVRAARRDDPVGAVDRRAREPGHAGAVQALPERAALAKATTAELEPQIHSTGFFRAKSKALIGMAQALVERSRRRGAGRHGGADRSCPASAARRRTSCSATRSACPGCRSIATCCASRTASASPSRTSPESSSSSLCEALPPARWTRTSDTLILHGRRICKPKPLCDQCAVRDALRLLPERVVPRARPAAAAPKATPVRPRQQFERLVADALASIPRRFRDAMHNIAIVVEDEPSPELLEEMEIEPPDTLLGLYQGTPLTERRWEHGNDAARPHSDLPGSARARSRKTRTISSSRSPRR